MELVSISLLNGIIYGLLLFVVSAGLTLVFGMMGILNMAHASFYMMGAYVGYSISSSGHFWLGLFTAPLFVGAFGALVEKFLLRRIHEHGHGQELVFTFGLFFVIQEFVKIIYGNFPVHYEIPKTLAFRAFALFGEDVPFYRVFMGLVAVAMFLAIWLLLTKTRLGLILRAAEQGSLMTSALGHDVGRVFNGVFAAGAALAGLAGAIGGAYYTTNPDMALSVGTIVFVVVVVGGLGSIVGSLWASLFIGVMTSFAVSVDWSLSDLAGLIGLGDQARSMGGLLTVSISSIADTIPFVLMILVLLVRPMGLMGNRQ